MLEKLKGKYSQVLVAARSFFSDTTTTKSDGVSTRVQVSSWSFKLHRLLLPKKDVIEYLKILKTKLEQQQDIANTVELMDEKLTAFFPDSKRQKRTFYRNVLNMWEEENNPTLLNVMTPYLNEVEIMILDAAPTSIEGIRLIIDNYEKSSANKMMMLIAAFSPLFYIGSIFAMANGLHNSVVVDSANIVVSAGYRLKGSLLALMNINEFMLSTQWLIIPAITAITIAYFASLPLFRGEPRVTVESIPLIGLPYKTHRANTSIAFLQTMGVLVNSGMSMESILSLIEKRSTPFLKHEVRQIIDTFELTGRISDSLNTKLFSKDILYLLSIYLQSKNPSKELPLIANQIQQRQNLVIKALAIAINIGGMVVLGIYLGLFSAGMFSVTEYLQS